MAIVKNGFAQGFSGKIGGVVFRQHLGRTVVSEVPDMSKRKLSPKQKENNKTMTRANHYARIVIDNNEARDKAQIRLNVLRNRLYTSLVREYFELVKAGVDIQAFIDNDFKLPAQNG